MNHQSLHLKWSMIHLQILKLDRPPPITNFSSKKLWIVKNFLHDHLLKTKYFCYRQWKRNCWSLKYFSSTNAIFCKKSKNRHFTKSDNFWGGVDFPLKFDQKWGGLHSLLECSNTTASPGHPRGPPPQNCRTATETSWKKGPGLEQPWGDSSGRPVTLIISSISVKFVIFQTPPPIFDFGG